MAESKYKYIHVRYESESQRSFQTSSNSSGTEFMYQSLYCADQQHDDYPVCFR
jgi:hypothetical protein